MNILIPDSWLREYLQTKATPKQIKEYLSLCGPSIERIHTEGKETIYTVEVTGNRPDSMSVFGIAREAAAILPRFGIPAKLENDPYQNTPEVKDVHTSGVSKKPLTITTDFSLNPRWTSVVIDNVTVKDSPTWLKKKLELTGIRSLNNVIDITNYLMRGLGQPAHAFDYDEIKEQTMILRASKKGEHITTLDGKSHTLPGGDIVIEDGSGRLIDLCGIMGAKNSSIKDSTKTVVLFLQTYNPVHIRKTSMALAHRTEAASLFEKGIDSELVLPAIIQGIDLMKELTGGNVASKLYDLYERPFKPYTVSVKRQKADDYIGKRLSDKEIKDILTSLGFTINVSQEAISVAVPSFRRDVAIDVDIIEELARLYGYHNIVPTLPDTAPPMTTFDESLNWEEEIKIRLRDWGYTETYTYSMISEELMDEFGLDKTKAYKITNPLSNEWVYMRPSLIPSMVATIKQNLSNKSDLRLFELSMTYKYRPGDLPEEKPYLIVAWTGNKFLEAKGLAEAIFALFGISYPIELGGYGSIQIVESSTILELDVSLLVKNAKPAKQYRPPPKYPPIYEDFTFVVPPKTAIGPMMDALKSTHPLVSDVSLLDTYEDTQTYHITYLSRDKNLTDEDVRPVREKLMKTVYEKFGATIKV